MFGDILGNVGGSSTQGNDDFMAAMSDIVIKMLLIGVGTWAMAWWKSWCWGYAGARQAARARETYLQSILRQDIAWFDTASVRPQHGVNVPNRVYSTTVQCTVHGGVLRVFFYMIYLY
jgi:hypothetical protein